jgi:hypothetical protein
VCNAGLLFLPHTLKHQHQPLLLPLSQVLLLVGATEVSLLGHMLALLPAMCCASRAVS